MSTQMSGSRNLRFQPMAGHFILSLTAGLVWEEGMCGFLPWMRQAPGHALSMQESKLILRSMKYRPLFMQTTKRYTLLPTASPVLVDTIFFMPNGILLYGSHRKTLAT